MAYNKPSEISLSPISYERYFKKSRHLKFSPFEFMQVTAAIKILDDLPDNIKIVTLSSTSWKILVKIMCLRPNYIEFIKNNMSILKKTITFDGLIEYYKMTEQCGPYGLWSWNGTSNPMIHYSNLQKEISDESIMLLLQWLHMEIKPIGFLPTYQMEVNSIQFAPIEEDLIVAYVFGQFHFK